MEIYEYYEMSKETERKSARKMKRKMKRKEREEKPQTSRASSLNWGTYAQCIFFSHFSHEIRP